MEIEYTEMPASAAVWVAVKSNSTNRTRQRKRTLLILEYRQYWLAATITEDSLFLLILLLPKPVDLNGWARGFEPLP